MGGLRRRSVAMVATAVILLAVSAVGYYFFIWLPRANSTSENIPPAAQPSPSPAQPSPPATQPPPSFEQKIENFMKEVEDARTAGESREVTLVITEDEANSEIAPRLAEIELPEDIPLEVESVHVDFQPDLVVTTLKGAAYGITLNIEVEAKVNVQAGKPKVEVVDIKFGWLPLPGGVKDQITGLITQKIEDLPTTALSEGTAALGVEWEVTKVDIQENQVTVVFGK